MYKQADEYAGIGTQWVAIFFKKSNTITYFDSFGVDHIPKEIEKLVCNQNVNISRIHTHDSTIRGFIEFALNNKAWYT